MDENHIIHRFHEGELSEEERAYESKLSAMSEEEYEAHRRQQNEEESCRRCGRPGDIMVMVPDKIWARISNGDRFLCPWCIDAACFEMGLMEVPIRISFEGRAIISDT